MSSLTIQQVGKITMSVEREQIAFSHLADDLIDHICCMVEKEMENGLGFEEAFSKVITLIGPRSLKKVEEKALLLIDTKYRIMKTSMKVFALISLIAIAFGAIFKTMHWPGAGPLLALGFATLALVFYPSAIFVMKRENRIKGGNFIYLTALIGGMILIFGILFKLMHWPGAGIILLAGFVSIIGILIPSLLISKMKSVSDRKMKTTYLLGALFLMLILAGECCKFFHWPGAAIMLLVGSLSLSLIWLPLYAFYAFKESSFVKGGFIFLCIAMVFFNMYNMLLALNVSKDVLSDYVQPGVSYNTSAEAFETYNAALIQNIEQDSLADSSRVNQLQLLQNSSRDLCSFIEETKVKLIMETDLVSQAEADKVSQSHQLLINKAAFDIATLFMCGPDLDGKNGKGSELQQKIEQYRVLVSSMVSADKIEKDFIENLLSTNPPKPMDQDQTPNWVIYNFYHIPTIAVLNTLSRLKTNVLMVENTALKFIASQPTGTTNNSQN